MRLALEKVADDLSSRSRSVAVPAGTPLPPPLLLARADGEFAFVGRERERQQIGEVWKRAKLGRRQLLLMAGEPGIGKTRLSLEFARTCADEHATVLVGRCDEEALVPYQPFVEALGWYARVCPEADLHAALAAAGGGGELGPFVTDFLVRVPELPPPMPMNAQGQRYRLFETVNALLAATSKAFPVLLILDDLHWADKPTLSMLRHIVRGSDPAALCIVGTYRENELGEAHPLAELLADFRREQDVTRLSLTGLEPVQVGRLVETLASPEVSSRLAEQMTDSTGGNPFFVAEMLRHLRETGALAELREGSLESTGLPEGVREVISRRVSRLSEGCRRAMTLASVLGREFDVDVLEALGDLSEDELLDAIDEARRAQIIDEVPGRPGRYSFHHALIRDTFYGGLAASRRLRLHRRAGEALERLTAHKRRRRWPTWPTTSFKPHPPASPIKLPTTRLAPATGWPTRSRTRRPPGSTIWRSGARLAAGGTRDRAAASRDSAPSRAGVRQPRAVGAAASGARAGARPPERGRSRGALRDPRRAEPGLLLALRHSVARARVHRSPEPCRTLGRKDLAANSMGWLARCRQAGGGLIDAIEMDRATIARFGAAAKVSHSFGSAALYWAGRGTEAVAVARAGGAMAETSHDATFTMNALSHYGLNLAAVGRYAEAIRVFARAQEFGRKYGALPLLARATSMSAGFRLGLGDLDGGEADSARGA